MRLALSAWLRFAQRPLPALEDAVPFATETPHDFARSQIIGVRQTP